MDERYLSGVYCYECRDRLLNDTSTNYDENRVTYRFDAIYSSNRIFDRQGIEIYKPNSM